MSKVKYIFLFDLIVNCYFLFYCAVSKRLRSHNNVNKNTITNKVSLRLPTSRASSNVPRTTGRRTVTKMDPEKSASLLVNANLTKAGYICVREELKSSGFPVLPNYKMVCLLF